VAKTSANAAPEITNGTNRIERKIRQPGTCCARMMPAAMPSGTWMKTPAAM
jgi:hypothetical protein